MPVLFLLIWCVLLLVNCERVIIGQWECLRQPSTGSPAAGPCPSCAGALESLVFCSSALPCLCGRGRVRRGCRAGRNWWIDSAGCCQCLQLRKYSSLSFSQFLGPVHLMRLIFFLRKSVTIFVSSIMIIYMKLQTLLFRCSLRLRCSGAQGLPLLARCLQLMAWHDYTANLGLQGGCRPIPALNCRLLRQVVRLLIWQSSLLHEAVVQGQAGVALDHREKTKHPTLLYLHLTLPAPVPYLVRSRCQTMLGKEHSRQKARGNLEPENSVAAGNWNWRSQNSN